MPGIIDDDDEDDFDPNAPLDPELDGYEDEAFPFDDIEDEEDDDGDDLPDDFILE